MQVFLRRLKLCYRADAQKFIEELQVLSEAKEAVIQLEDSKKQLLLEDEETKLMVQLFSKTFPVRLRYKSTLGEFEGTLILKTGPKSFKVTSSAQFYELLREYSTQF